MSKIPNERSKFCMLISAASPHIEGTDQGKMKKEDLLYFGVTSPKYTSIRLLVYCQPSSNGQAFP